ncbi:uncharacterized protein LOC141621684 [Silene latifolia]|uniref:uncharacterized protein LOC141621684 n=1 Tax=Silene latifolia TaxID=37657 RepID=UPI003D77BC00
MITMLSQTPKVRQYDATARFFEAKLERGQKVGPHVLKMVEFVDILERLGYKIPKTFVVDRILHSLPTKFAHFRLNYNMNGMDKSYHEIHALLTQAERNMEARGSEKRDVLTMKLKNMSLGVKKGKGKEKYQFKKSSKKHNKGKGKAVENGNPKAKSVKLSEAECFHCNGKGHYRRSCRKNLEDLKEGRVMPIGMISSLYVIDGNYACTSTWVLDTGCGSHLCNHLQGLRDVRALAKGDVDHRMGNGARVAAVSVGTYVLTLASGLELYLNKCYFVPTLTKNIISISALDAEGFCFMIKDNSYTFSLNDVVYGKVI